MQVLVSPSLPPHSLPFSLPFPPSHPPFFSPSLPLSLPPILSLSPSLSRSLSVPLFLCPPLSFSFNIRQTALKEKMVCISRKQRRADRPGRKASSHPLMVICFPRVGERMPNCGGRSSPLFSKSYARRGEACVPPTLGKQITISGWDDALRPGQSACRCFRETLTIFSFSVVRRREATVRVRRSARRYLIAGTFFFFFIFASYGLYICPFCHYPVFFSSL